MTITAKQEAFAQAIADGDRRGFYVYALVDPLDGAVFYVGKGKGNRIAAHEKEARRGKAGGKCDRIRAIWGEGQEVQRSVVAWFDKEDDAFVCEAEYVAQIGLDNLTNCNAGGYGGRVRDGLMPFGLIAREWKVFAVARKLLSRGAVILSGIDCTGAYERVMRDAEEAIGAEALNAFLDQKEAEAYG